MCLPAGSRAWKRTTQDKAKARVKSSATSFLCHYTFYELLTLQFSPVFNHIRDPSQTLSLLSLSVYIPTNTFPRGIPRPAAELQRCSALPKLMEPSSLGRLGCCTRGVVTAWAKRVNNREERTFHVFSSEPELLCRERGEI